MPSAVLAILLKGYPRLSETFIAEELLALERRGLRLRLYSMRQPTDPHLHPVHRQIAAPVAYLPEYLYQAPLRVLAGWWRARKLSGYRAARAAWLADLRRDPTPNRGRRFGQALVLAAEMGPEIGHLHAHFLHTPSSVARYAATMRGLAWSASAHAKDIWTTPDWEKREKLSSAAWVTTCTRVGWQHLKTLAPATAAVDLIYHGLDGDRFPPLRDERPARDGSDPQQPVRLLTVGRAVAKKGFDDLLSALALLPPGLAWRLSHIGGGPLLDRLKRQAQSLGLAERIDWLGPQPQDVVLQRYREADLFVLASRIAKDGDRDGLPNVLVEALSQRLAAVATEAGAIGELIADGVHGLLVAPGDPPALAAALARLLADPALRRRLGQAGEARVRSDFTLAIGADRIAQRLLSLLDRPTLSSESDIAATAESLCASPSTRP